MIFPAVEEVLVRQLVLREEVHVSRVGTSEHVSDAVEVRRADVVVTRQAVTTSDQL